jgi:protein TonB
MVFVNKGSEEKYVEEVKPVDTITIANIEGSIYDSTVLIEPTIETVDIQKVQDSEVQKSEQKIEQKILPKAPPKLPELIEAPLITTNEVENKNEKFVVEEISNLPPNEIIEEVEEPTFFVAVEEMPQPIGGLQSIMEKIKYPEIAKRAGVEGKVFVRAFVDENGNVVNAEIIKGIGAGCDEAALDAVIKTKFTPGKQRGKPIKVQITVPVHFKL